VEILPGSASEGGNLAIQVYDGVTHDRDGDGPNVGGDGPAEDWQYDSGNTAGAAGGWASDPGSDNVTVFRVYAPDATPSVWTDNPTLYCAAEDYHSLGNRQLRERCRERVGHDVHGPQRSQRGST
jgi:hypothetical protein